MRAHPLRAHTSGAGAGGGGLRGGRGCAGPGAPPPGTNNWSCRPSEVHPDPVILVHGLFANETDNWQTYGPLLADHGYCVFAFTYGNDLSTQPPLDTIGGLIPMEQSAEVLGSFVLNALDPAAAAPVPCVPVAPVVSSA